MLVAVLVACGEESKTVAFSIEVSSSEFSGGGAIPARYTCSGEDVSPPLRWSGVPDGARSLALTVIDPDAPGKPFVHWLLFNMPASTGALIEDATPPAGSAQGRNDLGVNRYRGPCPPAGSPHHYHFKVYALDLTTSLRDGASEADFEGAIKDHVLASGELVGTFKR